MNKFLSIIIIGLAITFLITGCDGTDPEKDICTCLEICKDTCECQENCSCECNDFDPVPLADSYRILCIGHSYSNDVMRYMYDILVKNGVPGEEIEIVNAFRGDESLENHVKNAKNNSANYDRNSFGAGGALTGTPVQSLRSIIESSNWDVIILQQKPWYTGLHDTAIADDLTFLISYVKEHAVNSNVKIGWHMTWSYAQGSQHLGFPPYNSSEMIMYNLIMEVTQANVAVNSGLDFIIPAGTAIQNARTVFDEELLTLPVPADGGHLSGVGRFIAGAMWLYKIYGLSVDVFDTYTTSNGTVISRDQILQIDKIVKDAFRRPYKITEQ